MVKEGLLYSASHEWVKVEGQVALMGISDHAQHELGEVVFIELPKVGQTVKKGASIGAVESVKAASDLYSPVSGKIIEVNSSLEDAPESLNSDPYGSWIMKIELSEISELEQLLDHTTYENQLED